MDWVGLVRHLLENSITVFHGIVFGIRRKKKSDIMNSICSEAIHELWTKFTLTHTNRLFCGISVVIATLVHCLPHANASEEIDISVEREFVWFLLRVEANCIIRWWYFVFTAIEEFNITSGLCRLQRHHDNTRLNYSKVSFVAIYNSAKRAPA